MSWRPFTVPLALPLLFTAAVLVDVQRNRSGSREAIDLGEREVAINAGTDENSAMTLRLRWTVDASSGLPWLTAGKLRALGFDVTGKPQPGRSRREPQRRAYVVFELRDEGASASRLVPVDASPDREALLARYPDGRTSLVTAAVVGVSRDTSPGGSGDTRGYVANIEPALIHVPVEFAEQLRAARRTRGSFTVSIRYGSRLEPWIVGVRGR